MKKPKYIGWYRILQRGIDQKNLPFVFYFNLKTEVSNNEQKFFASMY